MLIQPFHALRSVKFWRPKLYTPIRICQLLWQGFRKIELGKCLEKVLGVYFSIHSFVFSRVILMTLKIYLTTLRNEDKNSQKIGRLKNNWNKFIIVDISPSVVHRFQISIHSECCLLKTAGPIWTKLGTQLPQGSLFAFLVFNGSGAYLERGTSIIDLFFFNVCTCGFPTTGGGEEG